MASRRSLHAVLRTSSGLAQSQKLAPAAIIAGPQWKQPSCVQAARARSAYSTSAAAGKNHIHNPIRNIDAFQTALSSATSTRRPLLTLWTTSYCPTCRTVSPLLQSLVSSGVGEAQGGVSFAEVEFDSPDIMGGPDSLPMTYMITSVPTLLSFDGGEAMTQTKVVDGRKLADRAFLEEWIRTEAERRGGRGGGGGGGESLFGGLFGNWKS